MGIFSKALRVKIPAISGKDCSLLSAKTCFQNARGGESVKSPANYCIKGVEALCFTRISEMYVIE